MPPTPTHGMVTEQHFFTRVKRSVQQHHTASCLCGGNNRKVRGCALRTALVRAACGSFRLTYPFLREECTHFQAMCLQRETTPWATSTSATTAATTATATAWKKQRTAGCYFTMASEQGSKHANQMRTCSLSNAVSRISRSDSADFW